MKFKTHNDAAIDTDYTSLQGSIQATLGQLIKAFGRPLIGRDMRVPREWHLKFDDGTVATIYLWKREVPEFNDVVDFRIGGVSPLAVTRVHQAFRTSEGLRASA